MESSTAVCCGARIGWSYLPFGDSPHLLSEMTSDRLDCDWSERVQCLKTAAVVWFFSSGIFLNRIMAAVIYTLFDCFA